MSTRKLAMLFLVAASVITASFMVFGMEDGFGMLDVEAAGGETISADVYVDDDADAGWYDASHVKTIQEGVDNATAGDTVFVYNGTYYENVVVNKTVDLVGEDRNGTIIDGGGSGNVVKATADNISISGFTVRDSGPNWSDGGIYVHAVRNCRIENIAASANSVGVFLHYSRNCTITNITVSNNDYGIMLDSSSNYNTITNATAINNTWSSIRLHYSRNCTITNTTISNNNHGIYLYSSRNCTITNITATNNIWDGIKLESSSNNNTIIGTTVSNNSNGIYLCFSSNSNTITSTTISNNGRGIYSDSSNNNTIIGTIISNNGYGIHLYSSSNWTIINTTMVGNGFSIGGREVEHWNTHIIDTSNTVNGKPVYYWKNKTSGNLHIEAGQVILANCSGVTVESQNVSDGTVGVELGFSSNCAITATTVSSNNNHGIYLYSSRNCTITNTTASNNYNGIYLYSSRNCTITNTTASNNYRGIRLDSSSNYNTITNTTVSNNDYGIRLWSSSNNLIYHNNFINSQNAQDNGDNIWYNATLQEGNYWSDFDEASEGAYDNDSDGIVDSPYNISGGDNQDMYPLMGPLLCMDLDAGWNLITVPVATDYNASSLGQAIPGCTIVAYWDAATSTFQSFVVGSTPPPGFTLQDGRGYYVYVQAPTAFSVTGAPLSTVSVDLYEGWNTIGWYNETETNASSLGTTIDNCTIVAYWNASSSTFQSYLVGVSPPAMDFRIERGMGVFVYVTTPGVWHDIGGRYHG